RRTLARRLHFDLVGLPPEPEELEAFVRDPAPDAYERLADRLLASPRHGERWGRHWLDVVRYADTAGDNADYPVPEARLYRDYVIDSFNADKPWADMVREQIAGDLLARRGPRELHAERIAATGFLALARRYGTGPYELWHLTLEDAIDTVGRAFLGLSLRCARCHDHKHDPVTQEDYYALYGIFASTRFPWAGSEEVESKKLSRMRFVPLAPEGEAAPRLAAHEGRLAALREEAARLEKETPKPEARLNALRAELRNLEKPGLPPDLPGAYAVTEGDPADAAVQARGEPGQPERTVPRGVPAFLCRGEPIEVPPGSSGRLELAEWLVRPEHPVTARLIVNRLWAHHFGRGIVATPSDFGLRGERPTHPELLDWLARRLLERGGSLKALHRAIVTSRTYRLSSSTDERCAAEDPTNRLLWRFERRRLDAEALRDAIRWASGELDLSRPGPHPFPGPDAWRWTQHNPFKAAYPSRHRSVYLMTQRIQRHPFLGLFDGPDANTSTDVRASSNVPLQALFLKNNPFIQEQAGKLARRLLAEAGSAADRVRLGQELAWSRPPCRDELERALGYLDRCREEAGRGGATPGDAELAAWTSWSRVLLLANESLYLD
ncbi:MAG: DUF1553 domain-containing protein, partial [Planctomycetes bacterium]|nr:DUF1553 domain-containing protein [Planctomycetota bacterium]